MNDRVFECVSKEQYEEDPCHADYREVSAKDANEAKYKYGKEADVEYTDVLCRTKKGFPQWG